MSGVVVGLPLRRPVVVSSRTVEPSFQICPTAPPVSRYASTCSLPCSCSAAFMQNLLLVPLKRSATSRRSRHPASGDDLGRSADHPREARHRLQRVDAGAELDVRLE